MTSFTVRHVFNTDADTFWNKMFFDEEYNRRLFVTALGFPMWEQLELREESDGAKVRKTKMEPKSDAPAVVKKLVGDSVTYIEEGKWNPATRRWVFKIVPGKMADKIRIEGEFWVEQRGQKQIERICTTNVDVKIFGVGGAVESFIEKSTRDSYEKAAVFSNEFIKEKGY